MASKQLSISSPELLAEYVRQEDLKGFFEKRLATPPDHMAMLIRNGEIIDTYKGAHFSIGGIVEGIKSLFVGSSHVSILLADLKPFAVKTTFSAITSDQVPVAAEVTMELQVNPDKPANVIGLMSRLGTLTEHEVLNRIKAHLQVRVLETQVSRLSAEELRGNNGMQDLVQAEAMREVERVAGDLGLMVRAVSLEWGLNDVERQAIDQAERERQQQALDFELTEMTRALGRQASATKVQLATDLELAKLQNSSETELAEFIAKNEVRLEDYRTSQDRRHELEQLMHEATVLRERRQTNFQEDLANADHQLDMAQRQLEMEKMRRESEALQAAHQIEMDRIAGLAKIELQRAHNAANREHIGALNDLEASSADSDADRDIRVKDAETDRNIKELQAKTAAEEARMRAATMMTSEQLLAMNAGLSPEVANVLVEQAKAKAGSNEESMNLMKQLVTQANEARIASEAQAREMFQMGMDGAARVAYGAGGRDLPPAAAPAAPVATTAGKTCPSCGFVNPADANFCMKCKSKI